MDGSHVDHSDSDSGESWTLLEDTPPYADDAPDFVENNLVHDRNEAEIAEKDEDTDGISIITDSDPESTPCELSFERYQPEENRPTEIQIPQYVSVTPLPPNNINHHESIRSDDDFLGDNNGKHKTYVHRRNKRLSTVLNIIVLGSVITAAGVAIGHMWGARNECSMHPTPSVNKILSNLYKLQEENAYLRNKLKELTLVTNMQIQNRKSEKMPYKQQRCKKVFEEPLTTKNTDKLTKCIDDNNTDKVLESHLVEPAFEKEFLNDIDKLKNIYQQNKSFLDGEVARKFEEIKPSHRFKNNLKTNILPKVVNEASLMKDESLRRQLESISETPGNTKNIDVVSENSLQEKENSENLDVVFAETRISYADSLKSDQRQKQVHKRNIPETVENKIKDYINKKKAISQSDNISENSTSEDEFRKDDRYTGKKNNKQDKKKHDRHKLHKKQKRKNKYEQWEMKGGYMKDFDVISIGSSLDSEQILQNPDKNFPSREFERKNYINQFSETTDKIISNIENVQSKSKGEKTLKNEKENNKGNNKEKDSNWFDKRASLRTEARKKLERELYGESTSPNAAGWYFRRMQRREQCRSKGDNSTYRKLSKRNMNFKTKH